MMFLANSYSILHIFHVKIFGPTYARHYKPRLVIFLTQFSLWLRLILQTIYVLKMEILHFLSSKSAAYKRERLQIESCLWWRAYGSSFVFCVQLCSRNDILFWKWFWPTVRKTFAKSRLKTKNLILYFFSLLEQFIWALKDQNNFWNTMLF